VTGSGEVVTPWAAADELGLPLHTLHLFVQAGHLRLRTLTGEGEVRPKRRVLTRAAVEDFRRRAGLLGMSLGG
jgi:hypothetical protein